MSRKQAEILLYTKDYCPYCVAAKNLLDAKGAEYREIDVGKDEKEYAEMLRKAAPRKTVPQIFADGQALGGFDDIRKLDQEGRLNALLFRD
jgi:glutaredoxin 3